MHFLLFDDPKLAILYFVVLILSLSVHEFAHAWSAFKLGDDTAARMGRLSLNPMVHADPIGTIAFPLLGVPFGWAKPVPVNPARFRRDVSMGRGMAITAAAGPVSNVLLALACAVLLGLLVRYAPDLVGPRSAGRTLLVVAIGMNVNLALFNLLPVPPLDGSRIVDGFVPYRLRPRWEAFTAYAPFMLVAIFLFGGRIIAGPSNFVLGILYDIIRAIRAA
ncbi:MAG TPA: site-2 protease family protein [Anaeromyxobacteraceae bacterium]|nr:site-2 protease family protein [Anaeromyxobacteraceae bacterium]